MRGVRARVGRLEARLGAAGAACPVCRGAGREQVVVDWGEDPCGMGRGGSAPEALGCPGCGRVRRTTVRVDFVDRITRPAGAA